MVVPEIRTNFLKSLAMNGGPIRQLPDVLVPLGTGSAAACRRTGVKGYPNSSLTSWLAGTCVGEDLSTYSKTWPEGVAWMRFVQSMPMAE